MHAPLLSRESQFAIGKREIGRKQALRRSLRAANFFDERLTERSYRGVGAADRAARNVFASLSSGRSVSA